MTLKTGNGHDASGAKDELAREPLARQIYECLKPADPHWSVRVGLFGSWGLGKTTVADWIRQWAAEEGHVAVNFKIAAEAKETLFHALSVAIYDALKDVGVDIDSTLFSKTLREARNWAADTGKRLSGLVPNLYGAGGVVSSASESLQFGESDLTKIRSALVDQKKRIIVVIDDIDRLDASALPRILLVVRDLLDLPGFSFLLPFDEVPVIAALQKHISTEGSGEGFLEKILDFQFRLPSLSDDQRAGYFRKCIDQDADFLPVETIARLSDILPGTPRRLKSLARHLGLLRGSIVRHGRNEINWRFFLYAAILKQEDERFAGRFLAELLQDQYDRISSREERSKRQNEALVRLFEQSEIRSLDKRARLSKICIFGWEELPRTSRQWAYESISLLDAAPAMTQKELVQVLGRIKSPEFDPSEFDDLLSSGRMSLQAGFRKLAATMSSLYRNAIVAQNEAFGDAEIAAANSRWLSAISAFERVVSFGPNLPPPSRAVLFCEFYDAVVSFEDSERETEQVASRETAVFSDLISLLDQRELRDVDTHLDYTGKNHPPGIMSQLEKRIAEDLLQRFQSKSPILFFRYGTSSSLYSAVFTQPDGPFWSGETGKRWSEVLSRADSDPTIQRNLVDSLHLLYNFLDLNKPAVNDLVSRVWQGATAKPVGKKWQAALAEHQKQLARKGIDPQRIVIPAWLKTK